MNFHLFGAMFRTDLRHSVTSCLCARFRMCSDESLLITEMLFFYRLTSSPSDCQTAPWVVEHRLTRTLWTTQRVFFLIAGWHFLLLNNNNNNKRIPAHSSRLLLKFNVSVCLTFITHLSHTRVCRVLFYLFFSYLCQLKSHNIRDDLFI